MKKLYYFHQLLNRFIINKNKIVWKSLNLNKFSSNMTKVAIDRDLQRVQILIFQILGLVQSQKVEEKFKLQNSKKQSKNSIYDRFLMRGKVKLISYSNNYLKFKIAQIVNNNGAMKDSRKKVR